MSKRYQCAYVERLETPIPFRRNGRARLIGVMSDAPAEVKHAVEHFNDPAPPPVRESYLDSAQNADRETIRRAVAKQLLTGRSPAAACRRVARRFGIETYQVRIAASSDGVTPIPIPEEAA